MTSTNRETQFKTMFFLLISIALAGSLEIDAQRNNRSDIPISDVQYELLLKRKNLIESDSASDENEWSGQYLRGSHHPTVFMWSEKNGFLTWGSHHTFYPSRINYGKAEFSNGRLNIKPTIGKDNLHFQYIPNELVPIQWDETRFLIPPDKLKDFAYAAHTEAESQLNGYIARGLYSGTARKGIPQMPQEFEKILKMKALKPKIIAVRKGKSELNHDWIITLNRGKKHNLIEGMVLFYSSSKKTYEGNYLTITITEVSEKTSKAVIDQISLNDENFEPRIGLKFSSKARTDYFMPG